MRKGYAIILALFCFSLMSATVEELNIFDQSIHDVGISTADISEMNSSLGGMATVDTPVDAVPQAFDIFATIGILVKGVKIVFVAFGKTILIYPTLVGYGVHTAIAGMVQGLTTLVEVFMMIEFMTARRLSQ